MEKVPNILVIGDTHFPFVHKEYLGFCKRVYCEFDCTEVVHVGDLVDNHSISFHEHCPDGWSPGDEGDQAQEEIDKWVRVFKRMKLCMGNHDWLVLRKAVASGLPGRYFKSFHDAWRLPKEWVVGDFFKYGDIKFMHGTGYGGEYPHAQACKHEMQSVVLGHCHSVAGVHWTANSNKKAFGLAVGCGIDKDAYAFAYGVTFKRKPILGCGVITDSGEDARFIPMRMGRDA